MTGIKATNMPADIHITHIRSPSIKLSPVQTHQLKPLWNRFIVGSMDLFPGKKPSYVVWLIFNNLNNISLWKKGQKTINDINSLIKCFDADEISGCETQWNWLLRRAMPTSTSCLGKAKKGKELQLGIKMKSMWETNIEARQPWPCHKAPR